MGLEWGGKGNEELYGFYSSPNKIWDSKGIFHIKISLERSHFEYQVWSL